MHQAIPLALRALQLLFAIILLGLTAYLVSTYLHFSRTNFLLFTSIWTLFPALPYLVFGPRFLSPSANTKIIHLAIDALTALFWFAGFIALAAWYGPQPYCVGNVCGPIVATCVFGAFEWLLFTATSTLSALDFWRTRRDLSATKTAPETTVV